MQMIDNSGQMSNLIPVRFVDGEPDGGEMEATENKDSDDSPFTPEEIGRESSYDDSTEVQRRIDRGAEREGEAGQGEADDKDAAGAPRHSELPENREDQDTTRRAASVSAQAELLAAQAELSIVESELRKTSDERQELQELMARRQADFDNYRKRAERDRRETYQRIVAELVGQLLPVVDNLQRALDAEASSEATESEEFRHFLNGVGLIDKQLKGVLEKFGVEPVPTVGHPFNPHFHEAVATEQNDGFAPDIVTQEIARGYRIGDKLLRPAMVKVATK